MPNRNQNNSSSERTREEAPTIPIVLHHNTMDCSLLSPFSAKEPLDPSGSKYTTSGINGKGEDGFVSIVSAENAYEILGNVGSVIKVDGVSPIISTIELPYESDSSKKYHISYDERFPQQPISVILTSFEASEDKERKWKAVSSQVLSNEEPVVLLSKTVEDDEIIRTVALITKCLESGVEVQEGFAEACTKQGLDEIQSVSSAIKLIAVFDRYLSRTKENISKIEGVYTQIEASSLVKNEPMATIEDIKIVGGLEERYNPVSVGGVNIKSLSSARAVTSLLRGDFDKSIEDSPLDEQSILLLRQKKALMELIEDFSDLHSPLNDWRKYLPALKTTSFKAVGRDARGSISVMQNNYSPMRSNGEVYQAIKDAGKMDIVYQAERLINSIYFDNKEVSENILRQADDALRTLAYTLADSLYGEKSEIIKNKLKEIPSAYSLLVAEEKEKGKIFYKIGGLLEYARKAVVREYIGANSILRNNGLTRDNIRPRGTWFGAKVGRDKLFNKRKDVYFLNTRIPQLTFPIGSDDLVRFKLITSPVISVFRDKETGEVTNINALANISKHREYAKFGRVLNAITELKSTDEDIESKIRKLKGRGGKGYDGKLSNFGLSGIREEYPEIKRRLGSLINDIYQFLDSNDLDKAKEYILNLSSSGDENIRNVGMYIEAVKREFSNNDILSSSWYAAYNTNTKKIVINDLNGKYDLLNLEGKPKSKYLAKLLSLTISSCLDNYTKGEALANKRYGEVSYQGQNGEVKKDLYEKIGKDFSYLTSVSTGLVLMQKNEEGIKLVNPISERISHSFIEHKEGKSIFSIEGLEESFVFDSAPLVDENAIEGARDWYRANKDTGKTKDRDAAEKLVTDAIEKEFKGSGFKIDISKLKIGTPVVEAEKTSEEVSTEVEKTSEEVSTEVKEVKDLFAMGDSGLFGGDKDAEPVDNEEIINEIIASGELEAFSPDDISLLGEYGDDDEESIPLETKSKDISYAAIGKAKKREKSVGDFTM